jgi:PAS domain S-box-containing protein
MGTSSQAANPAVLTRPLRALVLEDDPLDAELMVERLRQAGYYIEFDLVGSSGSFREFLQTGKYDIILADYNLRTWNALDALEILKQSRKNVPFIVVTGALGDEKAADCIKQGAVDYVLKDWLGRLPEAIRRALEEKTLRDEKVRVEELNRHLAAIVESSDDAIIGEDLDCTVVSWNAGAEKVYGYSATEAIGQPISILVANEHAEEAVNILERIKRGGSVTRYETAQRRKDGQRVFVTVSVSPIKDREGHVVGASTIARDITKRKRAEEALALKVQELARSNADLEQFAYVASHDLQEPLRTVASFTQLLQKRYQGKLDRNADEFIAFIVEGATRMMGLINDLLSYSRVGTRGRDFAPTDCAAVFKEAVANLGAAIEESGALVTRGPLPTVVADGGQLVLLLQNLIGNAIKFHSNSSPRVHVAAERREQDWAFSVEDNGIGIDPQYAQRIFEVFQRLHSRADYPGTGIGLAICKKIVERHRGRIWVRSRLGEGATFYFTIPF